LRPTRKLVAPLAAALSVAALSAAGLAMVAPAADAATSAATSYSAGTTTSPATSLLEFVNPGDLYAGIAISIPGTLMFGEGGTPAAGTPITISRTNPGGTTTSLGTVTTNSSGYQFFVDDTVPSAGTYTYNASFAGNADGAAATASLAVTFIVRPTDISLSGPSSVVSGKSFTISGQLGNADYPATISVVRTNPNHTTTSSTVRTGAATSGYFTIAGKLTTPGTYSYVLNYAGSPAASWARAKYKLTVVKPTPALTLSTSSTTVQYGSTVKVTAHLGSTHTNRTVSISASYPGSKTVRVLKTGTVNSAGNLTISYPDATRNVVFTVKFSGDSVYGAKSASARVNVDARVALSISGWYTSARHDGVTYRVFHHTRDLDATITVTPNKHGECVRMDTAELVKGSWVAALSPCFTLNSQSQKGIEGSGFADGYYRVRAVFDPSKADVTNVSYYSGWFYFEIVK
jgi:hypothetical protein